MTATINSEVPMITSTQLEERTSIDIDGIENQEKVNLEDSEPLDYSESQDSQSFAQ
uniref:Uncharacterized protein n=1 Tax=Arundo donax TaxID=35708 RepID=A0A0A8ZB26_ARUDO